MHMVGLHQLNVFFFFFFFFVFFFCCCCCCFFLCVFFFFRSKNVTLNGYRFLMLEVRVPTDGLRRSSNWCLDYQYLCEDFHRKPTGCGVTYSSRPFYSNCRNKYNSDMAIGDTLGCNPSNAIARLANTAFPNLSPSATYRRNAFGFTCVSRIVTRQSMEVNKLLVTCKHSGS